MTDEPAPTGQPAQAFHLAQLRQRIEMIAARLDDLADAVQRHADLLTEVPSPGVPTYAEVAAAIQHAVLYGLADLHLDGLTVDAQHADGRRVLAVQREEIAKRIEEEIHGARSVRAAGHPHGLKLDAAEFADDWRQAARIAREHGQED